MTKVGIFLNKNIFDDHLNATQANHHAGSVKHAGHRILLDSAVTQSSNTEPGVTQNGGTTYSGGIGDFRPQSGEGPAVPAIAPGF
jgi:hypothetical protein